MDRQQLITVGKVVSVYGVKGWIKVYSYTDPIENILLYRPWFFKTSSGDWQEIALEDGRKQGKGLVALVAGCHDRDQARQTLVGREIAVEKTQLPDLEEGEYYWRDLVGLRVVLRDGRSLGTVFRMLETGANDVMQVKGDSNSIDMKERLVPWVPGQVVKDVDLVKQCVLVDWDPEF